MAKRIITIIEDRKGFFTIVEGGCFQRALCRDEVIGRVAMLIACETCDGLSPENTAMIEKYRREGSSWWYYSHPFDHGGQRPRENPYEADIHKREAPEVLV